MHSYRHVKALTERLVAQALERLEGADPQAQTDTATQAHDLIRNPQEYGDLFARAAAASSPSPDPEPSPATDTQAELFA